MVPSFADLIAGLSTYFLQFGQLIRGSKLLTTDHFCGLACFCFAETHFPIERANFYPLDHITVYSLTWNRYLLFILLRACVTSVGVVDSTRDKLFLWKKRATYFN